jgi:hypothetical protein
LRWPLAIVLIGPPLLLLAQDAPPPGDSAPSSTTSRLIGAGSCAASACHNAHGSRGDTGSEHSLWITRDPHARAYQILFDKAAQDIQKKLRRPVPAYEDQVCLNCHVSPDFDVKNPPKNAPYFKTDGVSCESCHGPARDWINEHHLAAWQERTSEEKTRLGMADTRSLLGRAQTCVKCHIGTARMDVDHDLIAAGHPRLNFEFAAFHAGMPRHWPDAKDRTSPRGGPDWEARAWVMGQLVSAQAALELLAERAGNPERAWPEFAEHDCAACHHPLKDADQKRGFGKRKPGAMPWGNFVALTRVALNGLGADASAAKFQSALAELQKSMERVAVPDRKLVAAQARDAAALLKPLLPELHRKLPERMPLVTLIDTLKPDPTSADTVTQTSLALAALRQAQIDTKSPPLALERLQLPKDGAGLYNPDTIRKRLATFHKIR